MNNKSEPAILHAVSNDRSQHTTAPSAPNPASAKADPRVGAAGRRTEDLLRWKPALSHQLILRACAAIVLVLAWAPAKALAQTDEIQVYDASIAPQGIFNVMLHGNFTPLGRTTPAYPGAIIPNHSYNGGVEWAYGVTPWFEQGLYFPIYTAYSKGRGGSIDGFKIRELFVRPHADQHTLFYGMNFEFSFNYSYWESRLVSGEIRPIIGVNLGKWVLIYNPIVDTDYTGGLGGLQFNPSGRIAYNLNDKWTVAAEEYDGFGPFHNFVTLHNQFHEVWTVFDHNSKLLDVEAGVGLGLTAGSDKWTLKLMLSRDLNTIPIRF